MKVDFYIFTKQTNSTKIPEKVNKSYDCDLLDDCSIITPILFLRLPVDTKERPGNYAYIADFSRYYYVTDYIYHLDGYFVYMKSDPLASFRGKISGQNLYILRSSNESDGRILDNMYPSTGDTVTKIVQVSSKYDGAIKDPSLGTFVVGVGGTQTRYYMFYKKGFEDFTSYLFSDEFCTDFLPDWVSMFPEIKTLINPLQYVSSVRWYPFLFFGQTLGHVPVGFADAPVQSYDTPDNLIYSFTQTFPLSSLRHPQSSRGMYLNGSPYSHFTLFYPPFGNISIDGIQISNSNSLECEVNIDLRTGVATLKIFVIGTSHRTLISVLNADVGVDIEVTQIVKPKLGTAQVAGGVAATVGQSLLGNIGGAIMNGVTAMSDAAQTLVPTSSSIGSPGGLAPMMGTPTLTGVFFLVVDEDLQHNGRPLCKVRNVGTLKGYMLVAHADIALAGTSTEDEEIRRHMEGGFYYE